MGKPNDYNFEEKGTQADKGVTDWNSTKVDDDKIPFGITRLDELTGGIKPGSIIALISDPGGVGELFGYHFASVAPSYYITTVRPPHAIKDSFQEFKPTNGVPPYVDIINQHKKEKSSKLQNLFRKENDKKNYVIDTLSAFAGKNNYAATIHNIYNSAKEKDGATLLIFNSTGDDLTEDEKEALHMCDSVITIKNRTIAGERIEHFLEMTKLRGNRNLPQKIHPLKIEPHLVISKQKTG